MEEITATEMAEGRQCDVVRVRKGKIEPRNPPFPFSHCGVVWHSPSLPVPSSPSLCAATGMEPDGDDGEEPDWGSEPDRGPESEEAAERRPRTPTPAPAPGVPMATRVGLRVHRLGMGTGIGGIKIVMSSDPLGV